MFKGLRQFITNFSRFERKTFWYFSTLVVGGAWLVAGLMLLLSSSSNQVQLQIETPSQLNKVGSLTIDIGGAVSKPGIYTLPYRSRVADAVQTAGGFHSAADHLAISQSVNLAEPIEDGQKIVIPFFSPHTNLSTDTEIEVPLTISLNTASQKELESLTGIGEKKAADLIAGRPYTNFESARVVSKLSETQWDEIKKKIRL